MNPGGWRRSRARGERINSDLFGAFTRAPRRRGAEGRLGRKRHKALAMFGCGACALLRWLEIGSIGLAGHGFLSEPQIVLRDHAFSSVEPAFRFPHDLEQSERVMRFVAAGDRIPSQDHAVPGFQIAHSPCSRSRPEFPIAI